MYFSMWHFLLYSIVLIQIIKVIIIGIRTVVLKVCDELEFLLCNDVDPNFNRNEAYSYSHSLNSAQSKASDIVDCNTNITNIDFAIPEFPAGKRVATSRKDSQEVVTDPYQTSTSSALDVMAMTSLSRNVQFEGVPKFECNSQNDTSSFEVINTSVENPSCKISSDQNVVLKSDEQRIPENKITESCLSNASQLILQSEVSSSNASALSQRNVNPARNALIPSNEKQHFEGNKCYSDLHPVKNDCDLKLNELLKESAEKLYKDNAEAEQDASKIYKQLSSQIETPNFDVTEDNTKLKISDDTKAKSKSVEKNFKDPEVSLQTSNENNTESSIFNSSKDTEEEGIFNEIENLEFFNSLLLSVDARPRMLKPEKEDPYERGLRVGNPIYLNYLREIWPLLNKIDSSMVSLCKANFNKSLIREEEFKVVKSSLKMLYDKSDHENETAYHLYVELYKQETERSFSQLEYDVGISVNGNIPMNISVYMEVLTENLEINRMILFNVNSDTKKLRIEMATPKISSKRRKGKRRK